MTRLSALLAALLLALLPARAADTSAFDADFTTLAGYLNRDGLGPLEVANATLVATRVFSSGTQALPRARSRFLAAATQGEAGLAGTYLVSLGGAAERQLIRSQTETSKLKRQWVWGYIATEQRFFDSIEQGAQWQTATALLPSTVKCRQLAELCLESRDLLTRRAGLYWGYWVADAAYWKKVEALVGTEKDPTTKGIARRLLTARASRTR